MAARLVAIPPGSDAGDILETGGTPLTTGDLRAALQLGINAEGVNADESLRIYGIVLASAVRWNNLEVIGAAHTDLGTVMNHLARYDEAVEHFGLAIESMEASGDHIRIAGAYNNLAIALKHLGEPAEAIRASNHAYDLAVQAGNSVSQARALLNMGVAFMDAGDYRRALDNFDRSLKLAQATDERLGMSYNFTDMANVYRLQGNYELSIAYLLKSLEIKEQSGAKQDIASSVGGLGDNYLQLGQVDRAMPLLRRSLALARESGRKSSEAKSLQLLAEALDRKGEYDGALEQLRASLALSDAAGEKAVSADALASIAEIQQQRGSYADAVDSAGRAGALASETSAIQVSIRAGTTLGRAHAALGHREQARAAFEQAIAAVEQLRDHVAGADENRAAFLAKCIEPYQGMIALEISERKFAAALDMAERAKARVLLEVLRTGHVDIHKEMTPSELAQEVQLRRRLMTLSSQLENAADASASELRKRQAQARTDLSVFQSALYISHPGLEAERGEIKQTGLRGLAKLLPDERTLLVEFAVTPQRAFVFAVQRSAGAPRLEVRTIPIAAEELRRRVDSFRGRLAERNPEFQALSRSLYRSLLAPLDETLRGKTCIVIVPDGPLWDLPFDALQSGSGRYLVEDRSVFYAPSLTVLAAMTDAAKPAAPDAGLLVLANPSHDTPEAEREANELGKLYGPSRSTIYTGSLATEDALVNQAARFAVVHIAAHGTFDDVSPMYSHLILAKPAAGSPNDGVLEAWELMNLKLRARLVVLSGCETARGRFGAGEGLIGMSWALFVSGAAATVASQWKVESSSTTDLMLEFHRGLIGGLGKAEALRQARLKLLHGEKYAHPFYWAGFALIGNGF
jgi:CHAT domain-containing protein/Tfp pilus assembly protein PilF